MYLDAVQKHCFKLLDTMQRLTILNPLFLNHLGGSIDGYDEEREPREAVWLAAKKFERSQKLRCGKVIN